MPSKEDEFFAKLMETFREEADEHIKTLSDGLLELEATTSPEKTKEVVERIFREAHSLKGASRSVNQQTVQEICQALEDVLSLWKEGKLKVSAEQFDILHKTIDLIKDALFSKADKPKIAAIVQKLQEITKSKTEEVQAPKTTPEQVRAKAPVPTPVEAETPSSEEQAPKPEPEEQALTADDTVPSKVLRKETVRISLRLLSRIFQEIEELLMVKLFSQQQVNEQQQLLGDLRTLEKDLTRFTSEIQLMRQIAPQELTIQNFGNFVQNILHYLEIHQSEIKSIKEYLNKSIKGSEQNSHFIGSLIDTLLEDMKKILMEPINILFESLPIMVRAISRQLGKEITLEFQGGNIEIDRRVLEEIKDPVIHIIRNAIDHGIEPPAERLAANKPASGTIKIIAEESEGNNVKLSISDDGRGMNISKLKKAALDKGVLSARDVRDISDEEAIKLAFRSDISTSPIITDLSGRGLGLGIVAEKVDKLGGRVSIDSELGKGTTFNLILPLTLATFRGVHISVANQDFIIPTHNLKRVLRIHPEDIKMAENREMLILQDHTFSFVHLADLLELPKEKKEENASMIVLLIKAADHTIAFGADAVHSEHEILVKSLGKQCVRVKNVMAATVMEWGKVVPILNPIDLIKSSIKGELIASRRPDKLEDERISRKSILLAEDSLTTRMLLKNILTSAEYDVKTAVDGAEAFEILQSQSFDLLITDVEMPRLDGFMLTEKVKKQPSLSDMPIIIVTARGSQEDRERGIELGASAYLDKNSFTQESFLSIVKRLL